ncbi:MAG: type I-U CRISPR-associated protein Csx17 [Proteobacteria bacterium]|nr:type I-U CRISPR-associated protein Csx17 [Pseudomonadota bacterium]
MTGHVLELRGCTPEPLGNYLKGLGVFRLIAEQADPQARAWWKDGVLVLHTKWSQKELSDFFLQGIGDESTPVYCPTPVFAPWGGRPGFYADGNERAKARLESLRQISPPGRFAMAQHVVKVTDEVLADHGWSNVSKKKRAELKASIIAAMRNAWSESGIDWFDACLALEEDARFGFLYGTGGNEGSADITNNFWELIEETIGFPNQRQDSGALLAAAVFGASRVGGTSRTAGQHFPFAAGSSNCGQVFFSSASTNPWDVVLMMEGAVLFSGATTKRLSQLGKGKAAFPFMIDHLATGEPSASLRDEAKQDAQITRCRAEFWMPLWSSPTSLPAIRALLAEGRLQRPSGQHTEHALHAMEAIKSLGVSRGVSAFHRVALFERRGKGYYLSSSLGFHSATRSSAPFGIELVRLDEFRDQAYRELREGPGIPDRVMRARQRFHVAMATLFDRDEQGITRIADAPLEVVVGAARLEREVASLKDRGKLLTPCPSLGWKFQRVDALATDYQIARAIAGIAAWGEISSEGRLVPAVESIRANLLPVHRRGRIWAWDETSRSAVWSPGASLNANLAAVLRRRLIDAGRGSGRGLPLWSSYGAGFEDLLTYWNGEVDEDRLTDLLHGLALADAGNWSESRVDDRQWRDAPTPDLQTGAVWFDAEGQARSNFGSVDWNGRPLLSKDSLRAAFELPRIYHLLKLCFLGGRLPHRPLEGRTSPRTGEEPFPPSCLDVFMLLQAGRLSDAAQLSARRLRAKGYPTVLLDDDLQTLDMDLEQCRRLAATLLIPVRQPGVCAALAIRPQTNR